MLVSISHSCLQGRENYTVNSFSPPPSAVCVSPSSKIYSVAFSALKARGREGHQQMIMEIL